jgi:hypothetical protein
MKKYKLYSNCVDLEITIEALSQTEAKNIVETIYNNSFKNIALIEII